MSIIAIVLGIILGGAADEGGFGAVVGGLLGWLLVRSHRQHKRIAALEHAASAAAAVASAVQTPPAPAAVPATPAAAEPAAPATMAAAPAVAMPAPAATVAADDAALWPETEPPTRAAAAPARPPAPPRPALLDPVKAWLFGGNTIVKAGVGILFIGLAFLAKYASEHVQLPVELRLAGIAAVAIALLVLGWRLRLARPGYAQALQGGAVAVLYLTLFAAFRFYGVLDAGPVFALLVLVAALAASLAVLQDARALAVIGALGGFATPLLVSTGSGNQVALFSYYLVLDLGIAAVAWFKTWRMLNLVGFAATFLVGSAWGVMRYTPEHYASSQAFLIAYFLLFNAILLMPARRLATEPTPQRADAWVNGSLLFGLPTISFVLQHGLVHDWPYGSALSALALAAFYVAMARFMRARPQLAVTFEASLAIAIVFLTLVIPFALDARSTAGAWALEGAGLVWLGLRQSRLLPRGFGYALLVLAGFTMMLAHDRHGAPEAIFNAYLFNGVLAGAAALAAALFVRRRAEALRAGEAIAEPLLIGWGLLWVLVAASIQIDAFVPMRWSVTAWLLVFGALALVCTLLSLRLAWPRVALPAAALAPLLAVMTLLVALLFDAPGDHGGWWAWPLALAAQAVVLRHAAPRWPDALQRGVHALGPVVLAGLGALQGRAITQSWGDAASAWAWLGWLVAPALLLLVLLHPALQRRWPLSSQPPAYQASAAVLTAGLLLWTLLANIASNGSARPLPHLPLINPLDLGIAVALLASWRWLGSDGARAALHASPQLPHALIGTAGFVWLNAIVIRGFHHYGGVPFRVDAWMGSLPVQTGLTLLWSATALVLMWFSARRARRLPWMVGAALLAAVVLKLLLVDLSGTGTVTRIVSFIGVGALMLIIGYVAPLPAAAKQEAGHAAS